MTTETPGGKSAPLTDKQLVIHYLALPPRAPVLFSLWLIMADEVWPGHSSLCYALHALVWIAFILRARSVYLIDIFETWRKK